MNIYRINIWYLSFKLVFIFSTLSQASVVYVSPTGNNSHSGTVDFPWQTIQHAENNVAAGDTVFVQEGIYNESVWMNISGDSINGYISFIGLGEVILQGSASLDNGFATNSSSYIHIENMTIRDYHREGIAFYGAELNPMNHIRLIKLKIYNSGISRAIWDHGIQLQYVNQFLVDSCEVINSMGNNIYINACSKGAVLHSIANGIVGGGYRDDSDGITVQNSSYVRIAHCVANYNPEDGIDIGGHIGPDLKHVSVYNCIANFNFDDGLCFSVTNGVEFDGYDVTFARCLSAYNASSGLICYQQPDDVKIIHNTIIGNKWGLNIRDENPQNFKIKNNIISEQLNYNFATNNVDTSLITISHTNWYNQVPPQGYAGNTFQNVPPQLDSNFELNTCSPAIDFGEALSFTSSGGTGSNIPVDYSGYFFDGYGIIDGDSISVDGQLAKIISIPNDSTITVDQSITWASNSPVSYLFTSVAPDLGWKEQTEVVNDSTTINIWVAGSTNEEDISLELCGLMVSEWTNIGGDFDNQQYVKLSYTHCSSFNFEDVRILFDDGGASSQGLDMNLRVDKIEINGVVKQTEAADVYMDGAYNGSCTSGFYQTEKLYCEGYIWYGWKCTDELIHAQNRVGTGLYQVSEIITSQAVVIQADQVTYRANNILLNPKFEVDLGATFSAEVNPCIL